MKVYDADHIRNVALVGHSGAGKTQLVSALLFDTGAVNRLGLVDDGTTVTDFDEEEVSRKHTLSAGTAVAEWNKTKINLIDTPGMANFFSDARSALRVADAAIVVVDAVAGTEVLTEKVWTATEELGLPCLVVLNRLDRERASLSRSLASLHEAFGRTIVPIQLPIGEEKDFRGVVNLIAMKAITFSTDGRGTPTVGDVPTELAEAAGTAREALIELVAEADDELMEKFFEAGTLTQEELEAGLKTAAAGRHVFPLVCTSATANLGIQPLLDTILAFVPSPLQRTLPVIDATTDEPASYDPGASATAALVWKTIADPFAGRITMFRVATGSLKSDSTIQNVSTGNAERVGSVTVMQGKEQDSVAEIKAGDLGAVAKLKETRIGDTLAAKDTAWRFRPFQFTEPVLSYAIEPKSRGDEEKISTALQRLQEEDPTIRYARDPQTAQLLLSGQGQLHIEVTVAKLKRRFGVEVNLNLPRIPYRETIKAATEAHGRHKKQTGGHGQFGDCKIKVAPLKRGEDFQFIDEIFGGSIPRGFIPAVEKGIREARERGYLAGYPMVDFQVTLFDGSFHPVDSNEMSFKMAGRLAFRDAMARAKPTLLEPVMSVEVYAPSDFAGDLMGDLNGRRGRIGGMETRGASTSIKAQVPMSEMLTYEQQLTSSTGGRGSYHMEFSHYEEVPAHIQEKVISDAKAARGEAAEEE
ncbi:MAG: elongation factor G [Acidobacteria bacterium]|jgi:elongation factor G|nr:elongation factor G [Acidobacteriota bacterium]HJN43101.1 elongation factor G [Vicinamibacterales bacterium]